MKKILVGLWIVLEREEKQPLGDYYTYRKMNQYNPLTWIFIIISIPILIFQVGYRGMQESVKDLFKW